MLYKEKCRRMRETGISLEEYYGLTNNVFSSCFTLQKIIDFDDFTLIKSSERFPTKSAKVTCSEKVDEHYPLLCNDIFLNEKGAPLLRTYSALLLSKMMRSNYF